MATSRADGLWALMREGEYYSVRDLANLSNQSGSTVTDVVNFLTKYGFIKPVATKELFTKSTIKFSPGESVDLLSCIADT
jgi:DNA-binding MarR family transcriptional regulator